MLSEKYIRRNGSGIFEIFCTFDSNPAAEIVWKRNTTNASSRNINVTELFLSSNVYNTRKKSVLRIDVVGEQMQGEYQCTATNQQGSTTQKTQLIVHCKYTRNMLFVLFNAMQHNSTNCTQVQHRKLN